MVVHMCRTRLRQATTAQTQTLSGNTFVIFID
jgi:hypothetical protein